jgi:type II secretion system protein D
MVALIVQALAQGYTPPSPAGTPAAAAGAGAAGALGGLGALGGAAGAGGAAGGVTIGLSAAIGGATKMTAVRFKGPKRALEASALDDVRLTADPRTNLIIISAPEQTIQLIASLVQEMDAPPAAHAEVKIFTLKKTDANQIATMLQQLFLGSGALGGAAAPVVPGAGAGAAGTVTPTAGAFTGAAGIPRPQLTFTGEPVEGVPLIDMRITIDLRTNSLVVAGSHRDLEITEAIVSKLEDSEAPERHNSVYKLKNVNAADVAAVLQNFVTKDLQVRASGGQLPPYQELASDVVIVPDPISNSLLISATPHYYARLVEIILAMDAEVPMVVVQVLVAEVDLNDTFELGCEIGLQSPILFNRSIYPAPGAFGTGTTSFAFPTNTSSVPLVPDGFTATGVLNPASTLGFNFNNVGLPLGNNVLVSPSAFGFQGLTNLGTGRSSVDSTTAGGGFVFSASNDFFNLLIRTLQTQQRLDILSRPQVMTLDRQAATILVGQAFPYTTGTTTTATGLATTGVAYRNIGIELDVTPQINADGRVTMRVTPQVSSVQANTIQLIGGATPLNAPVFNVQTVDTTVVVNDGDTVAIGGLISKNDTDTVNKVPCLGDLPYIGWMFRFTNRVTQKRELLVIMTPHVVRCKVDADRILAEEAQRVNWMVGDVHAIHGVNNMGAAVKSPNDGPVHVPSHPEHMHGAPTSGADAPPTLPPPRPLSPSSPPEQGATPAPAASDAPERRGWLRNLFSPVSATAGSGPAH